MEERWEWKRVEKHSKRRGRERERESVVQRKAKRRNESTNK